MGGGNIASRYKSLTYASFIVYIPFREKKKKMIFIYFGMHVIF